MDTQLNYPTLIKNILQAQTQYQLADKSIESHVVFDDEHHRYLLLELGWSDKKYTHDCIINIELINNKIWIQCDGTEEGIATSLLEAGVPNDDIVLGFRYPKLRQYTDFAVA
jgi:hypothetical protein